MTPVEPTTIDLVASLLHAYLDTSNLPPQVEFYCLNAAAELQRAGATVAPLPPHSGQVRLADITDALERLPAAVFESDPVLNAVAQLTAATSAWAAREH
jgi:acyl-CoA synthetase (AMP-forming)/AMP-acid ligase II